jgi:dolichyl-phosphate-mannose-protein mannosyltransferase
MEGELARLAGASSRPWTRWHWLVLTIAVVAGGAIRLVLLPATGFVGDLDQFVGWAHDIATTGIGRIFDQQLSFGPVMAYVWWLVGVLDPAIRSATDASAVDIRVAMKAPAIIADFGLAVGVGFAMRRWPSLAVAGAAVVLLHPAVWIISSWWGQYESVYVLLVFLAFLAAIEAPRSSRPLALDALAAVFLCAALLTKPQVLPLLLPFAAWFLARGWRSVVVATLAGLGAMLVIWLPFVPADGPQNYLNGLVAYQTGIFAVASLRAWNLWWLVQTITAPGGLLADSNLLFGLVSLRVLGYVLAGALAGVVAYRLWRRPSPRLLALSVIATTLVSFTFLTSMHERYAYPAVVFLALLMDEPRIRWLAAVFGLVYSLNLMAAASASQNLQPTIPIYGLTGVLGSVILLGLTLAFLRECLVARCEEEPALGAALPSAV